MQIEERAVEDQPADVMGGQPSASAQSVGEQGENQPARRMPVQAHPGVAGVGGDGRQGPLQFGVVARQIGGEMRGLAPRGGSVRTWVGPARRTRTRGRRSDPRARCGRSSRCSRAKPARRGPDRPAAFTARHRGAPAWRPGCPRRRDRALRQWSAASSPAIHPAPMRAPVTSRLHPSRAPKLRAATRAGIRRSPSWPRRTAQRPTFSVEARTRKMWTLSPFGGGNPGNRYRCPRGTSSTGCG